ncbi:hypothetical protein STEG23_022447, partial [Scotinomys teguina]
MARKAGQGKEEEESRARQQEEKTPVREEEEKPACHGGAHHVVEQAPPAKCSLQQVIGLVSGTFITGPSSKLLLDIPYLIVTQSHRDPVVISPQDLSLQ